MRLANNTKMNPKTFLFLLGATLLVTHLTVARAVEKLDGIDKLSRRDGNNNDNNNDYNVDDGTDDNVNVYNNEDDNNNYGTDDGGGDENDYKQNSQKNQQQHIEQAAAAPHSSSSGAYDNGPSHSGLAQIISATDQQTLDQIYGHRQQQQSAYQAGSQQQQQQQQNVRQDVLLTLDFARQLYQWDPRNNNSQWQWIPDSDNSSSDNAAIVVHRRQISQYHHNSPYEQQQTIYGNKNNDDDYVDLISIPFSRAYPETTGYNEGAVETKNPYTIGDRRRFLARMKFSCQTFNTENHPFPANLVTNPNDDPRLAECFFGLQAQAATDNSTIYLYLSVTNNGVWAVTVRASGDTDNSTTTTTAALKYTAKRRVGIRKRYDSLVDAGVEIDARLNVVNFYLNGYLVWTVPIGVPPPADGITSLNLGQGTPMTTTINSVLVTFGTSKCLDEFDPNNQASTTRLVNLGPGSRYYGANDMFYDPNAMRSNQLWGQGATMQLFKLILIRADSVPPVQVVLPGVYGPRAPEYQQQANGPSHKNEDKGGGGDEDYLRK